MGQVSQGEEKRYTRRSAPLDLSHDPLVTSRIDFHHFCGGAREPHPTPHRKDTKSSSGAEFARNPRQRRHSGAETHSTYRVQHRGDHIDVSGGASGREAVQGAQCRTHGPSVPAAPGHESIARVKSTPFVAAPPHSAHLRKSPQGGKWACGRVVRTGRAAPKDMAESGSLHHVRMQKETRVSANQVWLKLKASWSHFNMDKAKSVRIR
eukprot:scaffold3537_cov256-Pinguiococcus_pyrenoidosus.AAC.7